MLPGIYVHLFGSFQGADAIKEFVQAFLDNSPRARVALTVLQREAWALQRQIIPGGRGR